MGRVQVQLIFAHRQYRFSLRTEEKEPTFLALCEQVVRVVNLPLTPSRLADIDRSPLRLYYFDKDSPHSLSSEDAFRKALRASPNGLRLRMLYSDKMHEDRSETRKPSSKANSRRSGSRSRTKSKSPSRSGRSHSASRASGKASSTRSFSADVLASPTSLVDILTYLKRHGTRQVQAAIEDLQESIIVNSCDAAKLDEVRDNLARLFSVFLNRVAQMHGSKVPEDLVESTLDRFEKVGEEASISSATIESASELLRAITENKSDVHCLKEKWADIVANQENQPPDDKNRSSSSSSSESKSSKSKKEKKKKKRRRRRHRRRLNVFFSAEVDPYIEEFVNLIKAGDEEVRARYESLRKTTMGDSFITAHDSIDGDFCRSLEKCFFHAVRKHGMSEKHQVSPYGCKGLARGIRKRLRRIGLDEKFCKRAGKLSIAMAMDPGVVELIHIYAMNGGAANVADNDEEVLAMEEEFAEDPTDEFEGLTGIDDDDTSEDDERNRRRKRRHRTADDEYEYRRSRSRSRSRSHSRRRAEEHERRRSRSRSHSRSNSHRSGSRHRSDHYGFEAADIRWAYNDEDENVEYGSDETSSLSERTIDTSRSEWARIEMEKEARARRRDHSNSSGRRTRFSPPTLRRH